MVEFDKEKLQTMNDELRERMNKLQNFNPIDEIHAYCDNLVADVTLTFDSAFQHLQRLQDSMLAEIAEYRSSLIEAQRQRAAVLKEAQRLSFKEELAELADLKETIPQLNEHDRSCVELSLKTQMRALREQETELKKETMGGRFMRFKPNRFFEIVLDHVGTLEYLEDISPACCQVEIHEECFNVYKDSESIYHFMPGDRLVASTFKHDVFIYRASDLSMLERLPDLAKTVSVLLGERLMGGTVRGELRIYDLSTPPCQDTKREYIVLDSNSNRKRKAIFYTTLLPNGNLATSDAKGHIEIWDLSLAGTNRALLLCLDENFLSRIEALPNNFLVSCTMHGKTNETLKLWDLKSTQPLRSVVTPLVFVINMLALPNERVALGDGQGKIAVYDLIDMQQVWALNAKYGGISSFGHLPAEYLIGSDLKSHLNILELTSGKLVQTLETGLCDEVAALSISPDGKRMAVSSDTVLKIFRVDILLNEW